ncbi:MAG: apolipoprotein N-acyltransferase [Verrucomicrobiales bacterium]
MTFLRKVFPAQLAIRFLFAALGGFGMAAAFPKISMAGLAWAAPALLLMATFGLRGSALVKVGFVGGLVYFLTGLYWLLYIPLPFVPILGWIALSSYLACYIAAWCWLVWRFVPRLEDEGNSHIFASDRIKSLLNKPMVWRAVWALHAAVAWVALETVQSRFLSGFPWDLYGVSQYRMIPLIQIASITGVYGVSFLLIWVAASVFLAMLQISRKPGAPWIWAMEIILPMLVVAGLIFHGVYKLSHVPKPTRSIKAALIQPSIPQTVIWDPKENKTRFNELIKLSQLALQLKPDLLVWPEASVPTMIRYDEEVAQAILGLVKKNNVWAIVGSDDAEIRNRGVEGKEVVTYFNSSFAISPEGRIAGIYKKRQLVIFGEYVPFVKYLKFLKYLSPAGENGFTPGTEPNAFKLDGLDIIASVLICFEDVFPHLARLYVDEDTDFLLNLTNNGWFGESAAQWQHAASATFRAVENDIPLVRCTNNGLTCWVERTGAMREVYFDNSKDIYKAGFKMVEVPVLGENEKRTLTFYTKYGDIFGWSCFGITAASLLPLLARKAQALRERKKQGATV